MTIGERIKKSRETKGISQIELANAAKISKQNLYKYENNIITNIPSDKIESIAYYLEVSPAYLMGWDTENYNKSSNIYSKYPAPEITEDYVTFPVIGEIAAGYDNIAMESWDGDTVKIPAEFLKGRDRNEFFVLSVKGDSMYPAFQEGDKVLILKQSTLNHSGQIGAVLYDDECATLKKIEYVMGEDWMKLIPINPSYPPKTIRDEDLERCKVIGIPKLLIREIEE